MKNKLNSLFVPYEQSYELYKLGFDDPCFKFYNQDNELELFGSDIDEEDSLFVALSNHLHSSLWTGDKRLLNGLKKKGYSKVLSTDDLYTIYIEKEIRSIAKRK